MGKEITVSQEFKGNLRDYQGIVFRTEMKATFEDGAEAEVLVYLRDSAPDLINAMAGVQANVLQNVLQSFHGYGFEIMCLKTVSRTYLGKEVESADD